MERATYDLIVIGSGPAGEKGAAQAAYFDKKVALVEEAPSYGGAVANTGVPGKAMRETALYLSGLRQRDLHGLTLTYDGTLTVDRFMHRGRVVREALNQWIGANLDRHHVDVHRGRAAFVDAHTVAVKDEAGSRLLEAGVILIATGSTPYRPSTIPFGEPGVYDSDTILQMERLPRSLTIVGAAPSAASTPASSRCWAWTRSGSSTRASASCRSPTRKSLACCARRWSRSASSSTRRTPSSGSRPVLP